MSAENAPQKTSTSEVDPVAAEHEPADAWGWHHEFTTGRQIAGWITFLILGALLTTTHYNDSGSVFIVLLMLGIAGGLIYDIRRRRTQWRA